MTMALRPILTLCLALAFLISVTAQLMPVGMAQSDMGVRSDMSGGCSAPQSPCTGDVPNCVDHIGCLTAAAVPVSSTAMAVVFEWGLLDYDFAALPLSGISIKPELSPPILAV
jgi:hypothetical protein